MSTHFDDFFKLFKGNFELTKLILPILTAIGAWGGFPKGPRSFQKLTENKLFQYFFLWLLIVQGRGGVELDITLITVLFVFIITEIIIYIEDRYYPESS